MRDERGGATGWSPRPPIDFGRGLAVVHSAAVVAYGHVEEVPRPVMTAVVATNVLGTLAVCRAAMDAFRRTGGGHLVVIGSLLGEVAAPYMSSYVLSKWAVHGLVRTLQVEARQRDGVAVSLIAPGGIDTPIYRQAATVLGRHGTRPRRCSARGRRAAGVVGAAPPPPPDQRRPGEPRRGRRLPAVPRRLRRARHAADAHLRARARGAASGRRPATWTHPGTRAERGALRRHRDRPSHPTPPGGARHDRRDRNEQQMPSTARRCRGRSPPRPRRCGPCSPTGGSTPPGWSAPPGCGRSTPAGRPPGTRLHHSFGPWPAVISDATVSEEAEEPHHLVLTARGLADGEAGSRSRSCPTARAAAPCRSPRTRSEGPAGSCRCRCGSSASCRATGRRCAGSAYIAEGRHREWLAGVTAGAPAPAATSAGLAQHP